MSSRVGNAMSYTADLPKNLSHLRVGGLPEWSARPDLSKRKHLADLLALVGFSATILVVARQFLDEGFLEPLALAACVTLGLVSLAAYWIVRLRPADLASTRLEASTPKVPTFGSPPEPLCRRGGLAHESGGGGTAVSVKSALLRWTYYKSGSSLN